MSEFLHKSLKFCIFENANKNFAIVSCAMILM